MNSKKIIFTCMAAVITGITAPVIWSGDYSMTASAIIDRDGNEYTEGTYEELMLWKYSDHIKIVDCDFKSEVIDIPAEIDGIPVTIIEKYAFSFSNHLTEVAIPESVTYIGEMAFNNCKNLTSITINNPDCIIEDADSTISNSSKEGDIFTGTIFGFEGSTAQAYAEKYSCNFEVIGGASTVPDDVEEESEEPEEIVEDITEEADEADGDIIEDTDDKDTADEGVPVPLEEEPVAVEEEVPETTVPVSSDDDADDKSDKKGGFPVIPVAAGVLGAAGAVAVIIKMKK